MSGDNVTESARTEINEEEQNSIVGGENSEGGGPTASNCRYCGMGYPNASARALHEAVCSKNPDNTKKTLRAAE